MSESSEVEISNSNGFVGALVEKKSPAILDNAI